MAKFIAHSLAHLVVRPLVQRDYAECYAAMRAFTETRDAHTPDEIWLVEHPPVFTQGLAGKPEHLLHHPPHIALVQTDRGGQITYHGPGQLVVYVLFDLKRARIMVREWVQHLEQAAINTFADWGLITTRRAGMPGVYVATQAGKQLPSAVQPSPPTPLPIDWQGAKIAALGLKVRKGCSYHGMALNVSMDLAPFALINPCGYAGLQTVDLRSLGIHATLPQVGQHFTQHLCTIIHEPRNA